MSRERETTDPWRGIKRGDRFYLADWNAQSGDQLWEVVTDLWFDPVRGQRNTKRGYMVATSIMGYGEKRPVAVSTLVGKRYVKMEVAHARGGETVTRWLETLKPRRDEA